MSSITLAPFVPVSRRAPSRPEGERRPAPPQGGRSYGVGVSGGCQSASSSLRLVPGREYYES